MIKKAYSSSSSIIESSSESSLSISSSSSSSTSIASTTSGFVKSMYSTPPNIYEGLIVDDCFAMLKLLCGYFAFLLLSLVVQLEMNHLHLLRMNFLSSSLVLEELEQLDVVEQTERHRLSLSPMTLHMLLELA